MQKPIRVCTTSEGAVCECATEVNELRDCGMVDRHSIMFVGRDVCRQAVG
jgi:hypothetical protein